MEGMLTREKLESCIQDGQIQTVVVGVTDPYGKLCGKRLDANFFLKEPETNCCNYVFACDMDMNPLSGFKRFSYDIGYGDVTLIPAWETLRLCSWHEKTAMVLCDAYDGSCPLDVAPRIMLKAQVTNAKNMGFAINAATELEYFTYLDTYAEARHKGYKDLVPLAPYVQDYSLQLSAREEPLHGAFRQHLRRSGVPVESSKGEAGCGQHELNVQYSDAMTMADRTVVYKQCIKEVADQRGMSVTFMAKPAADECGSSCHVHISLSHMDGASAFYDPAANLWHGLRVTDEFKYFLGGLLRYVPEVLPFLAPTVNSYRRFNTGQWAPTRLAWNVDNRTTAFRVVGHESATRIEIRIPGADANPYLALAAIIGCGCHGIHERILPPPPFEGNANDASQLPRIASSLAEANVQMATSAFARASFGSEVIDHYVAFYASEANDFEKAVTDWEKYRYFERI